MVAIAGYYAARVAWTLGDATIRAQGLEPEWRHGRILASGLCGFLMMSGATAAVGASVVDQAPGRSAVVVSAGTFALVEAYGYPYRLGIDYRFGTRGPWSLEPGVGAAFGPDGMFFLHLDLQRDIQVGERWLMSFGLAGGYFANGDGIGVNDHLEFESSIALSRLLDSGLRVGLAVQHVSNGGLETPNNGTEALVVFVRFPLGRPARNLQVGP